MLDPAGTLEQYRKRRPMAPGAYDGQIRDQGAAAMANSGGYGASGESNYVGGALRLPQMAGSPDVVDPGGGGGGAGGGVPPPGNVPGGGAPGTFMDPKSPHAGPGVQPPAPGPVGVGPGFYTWDSWGGVWRNDWVPSFSGGWTISGSSDDARTGNPPGGGP